jgi:hypothetical protein
VNVDHGPIVGGLGRELEWLHCERMHEEAFRQWLRLVAGRMPEGFGCLVRNSHVRERSNLRLVKAFLSHRLGCGILDNVHHSHEYTTWQ